MKELEFYKDFYFFEDKRKNDLDGKMNLPILIVTIIFSIHFFVFQQAISGKYLILLEILAAANLIFVLISIYFLEKSYSNLANSHWYKELASMEDIRTYSSSLHEATEEGAAPFFEEYIKKELARCASENREINMTRTQNIGKSKLFLFASSVFTILLSVLYILDLLKT